MTDVVWTGAEAAGFFSMNNWRQSGINIREARPRDLEAIARLEDESFESDRVSRRSLREFLRASHRPVIAATIDDELAGYLLVSLRKGARALRIYSLAVDARFARRGVGRALLQACEAYARRHHREALTLEVRVRQHRGDRALRELRLSPLRGTRALLCGRGDRIALREAAASGSTTGSGEQSPARARSTVAPRIAPALGGGERSAELVRAGHRSTFCAETQGRFRPLSCKRRRDLSARPNWRAS